MCVNSFIISILYKATPDEVKFVMIDPKMVELPVYNGIPHLLIPVVTDPRKAAGALNWAVGEMMKRYQFFAQNNVRDLTGYNKLAATGQIHDENGNPAEKMTQIVIIIDELADLMLVAPNEVEDAICRLAQLARAAGIHLVVATQRPSVDVITGLITANIPSRIAPVSYTHLLRTAELPASVRELGENAFSKSGIERLSFPESLRTIGREDSLPFYGCQSLKEILVDPENLYYFSEGGVLFSKKKKTLLCYPAAKQGSSYVIPHALSASRLPRSTYSAMRKPKGLRLKFFRL